MLAHPVHADPSQPTAQEMIFGLLEDGRSYTVEELLKEVHHVSWAQVFLALDHLSRCGRIELRRKGVTFLARKAVGCIAEESGADAAAHPDCG